jgi:hypothetical protein
MCAKAYNPHQKPGQVKRFRVRCGNCYCLRRDGVLQPQTLMRAEYATYFKSEKQAEAEIKASVTLIENIRASMYSDAPHFKSIVAIEAHKYKVEEYLHDPKAES